MKKFISLIVTLAMVFSIFSGLSVAYADELEGFISITSAEEFVEKIGSADAGKYKLDSDLKIEAAAAIQVKSSDFTLNLNGHMLDLGSGYFSFAASSNAAFVNGAITSTSGGNNAVFTINAANAKAELTSLEVDAGVVAVYINGNGPEISASDCTFTNKSNGTNGIINALSGTVNITDSDIIYNSGNQAGYSGIRSSSGSPVISLDHVNITPTEASTAGRAVAMTAGSANITITGGAYEGKTCGIYWKSSGAITVTDAEIISGTTAMDLQSGSLTMGGNTYVHGTGTSKPALSITDGVTAVITGGVYSFDPAAYIPSDDGHTYEITENEGMYTVLRDGNVPVIPTPSPTPEPTPVPFVEVYDIETYNAAISAKAPRIKLTGDIDDTESDTKFAKKPQAEVEIDLNGHTLKSSGSVVIEASYKLIIDDSSNGNGAIINTSSGTSSYAIKTGSDLIVNGGSFSSGQSIVANTSKTDAELTINGGSFAATNAGGFALNIVGYKTIIINNCDAKNEVAGSNGGTLKVSGNSEVTINEGTFSSTTYVINNASSGSMLINGGTFTTSGNNTGVLYETAAADLVVNGGTFTNTAQTSSSVVLSVYRNATGNVYLNSGTFTGAIRKDSASTTVITIDGGTYSFEPNAETYNIDTDTHVVTDNGDGTYTVKKISQIGIDYENESLTGFVEGLIYTIDNAQVNPANGAIDIDEAYYGKTLAIVGTLDGVEKLAQNLAIPARPPRPSDITVVQPDTVGGKGTVSGITAEMEYSIDNGASWTDGDGKSIEADGGTTVLVCKKAVKDVSFRSESFEAAVKNRYSVTLDANGGTINSGDVTSYLEGTAETLPTDLTKEGYIFAGWYENSEDMSGEALTEIPASEAGNKTYYAKWNSNEYTITWNDDENNLIDTTKVKHGELPSHADPVKPSTAQYTYVFAGWSPEISEATADVTYTAKFNAVVNKYTITWKNEDGTVLEIDTDVEYGATPSYDGATPTKEPTEAAKYVFEKWSPEVAPVTGDAEYTAVFTSSANEYSINYNMNGHGTQIEQGSYVYGQSGQTIADDPAAEGYTFVGWYTNEALTAEFTGITETTAGDINLYAKWKVNAPENITIDFINEKLTGFDDGGYEIDNVLVSPSDGKLDVGSYIGSTIGIVKKGTGNDADSDPYSITIPERPSAPAVSTTPANEGASDGTITGVDNTMEYISADDLSGGSWISIDGTSVTGKASGIYYVRFKADADKFASQRAAATIGENGKIIIIFNDGDGNAIYTEYINSGTTPSYTGSAVPTKTEDEKYIYAWDNGWTPAFAEITEDTTYTATFTATPKSYSITYETNGGTLTGEYAQIYTYSPTDTTSLATADNITKEGHNFVGWHKLQDLSDAVITAVSADTTGNQTYYAEWEAVAYDIEAAETDNGAIAFEVSGSDTVKAHAGDTVIIRAMPENGYYLSRIAFNIENMTDITEPDQDGIWKFIMPDCNVTVTATFTQTDTSVSLDLLDTFASKLKIEKSYEDGDSVVLTASAIEPNELPELKAYVAIYKDDGVFDRLQQMADFELSGDGSIVTIEKPVTANDESYRIMLWTADYQPVIEVITAETTGANGLFSKEE